MIKYIFNRYKFTYGEDMDIDDLKVILFFGQLYSFAMFNEPLFEDIRDVFLSDDATMQQAYVLNYTLYGYKNYKSLYDCNVNLLDFEYFKGNADKVDINIDSWEW